MRNTKRKMIEGRTVEVQFDNIEKAIRKLKKKVAESGVLMEIREREHYTKRSVKKKVAKAVARKRWKKQLEKTALKPR